MCQHKYLVPSQACVGTPITLQSCYLGKFSVRVAWLGELRADQRQLHAQSGRVAVTVYSLAIVRHVPGDAPHATRLLPVKPEGRGVAEFTEAALEVLVEEGVQDRVEAAVDVPQGDAEVHEDHSEHAPQVDPQRLSERHDLDRGPAYHKDNDHHQNHSCDASQVAVLLLGTRQDAYAAKPLNHQAVADADDGHRNEERKEKHTSPKHKIPVAAWVGKYDDALNTCMMENNSIKLVMKQIIVCI